MGVRFRSSYASFFSVMPRQSRLDAPNTLHHVMVRGIERTTLFRDDTDRAAFVARLAALAAPGALTVYAWALLPTHAHRQVGLAPAARTGGGRRPAVARARAGIAYLWTDVLGHPGRPLAPLLGVTPAVVYQAARRGAAQAATWQRLLGEKHKTT
jgi:hypothetical protein